MEVLYKLVWFAILIHLFSVGEARVRYNSQVSMHTNYNISFADIDGDGLHDFYTFDGDKVYAATTEYTSHGLGYYKSVYGNHNRVLSGKFFGGATRDFLCGQGPQDIINHGVECFMLLGDRSLYQFWQHDFIFTDQIIVGDYNGDGYDDILCYAPLTGVFRAFTLNHSDIFYRQGFIPIPNWAPGNLGTSLLRMDIRIGEFGVPNGISDLIAYDSTNGAVAVFAGVWDGSSFTFWWWFSITGGFGGPSYELAVGDVNGDGLDDAVLHDWINGGPIKAYTVSWSSSTGAMPPLAINQGDISTGTNCRLFFAKVISVAGEDNGRTSKRDDIMILSRASPILWLRYDARFDGTKQTYWWSYTQYPIILGADPDGDSIITKHELGGYDPDNNGGSDGILPSYGASPNMRDVFVHADYMAGPPGASWTYQMTPAAVSLAVAAMAEHGINLHIFQGSMIPYQANLGNPTFDWARDFDPIKGSHMSISRAPFFHYCLFANTYNGGSSSGNSRGTGASTDFIVTLGGQSTAGAQASIFLHNLGHNLGLRHGAVDDIDYKPNHLSIMNNNYLFGVYKNGDYHFTYSDILCSDLNENLLSETNGLRCSVSGSDKYKMKVFKTGKWYDINGPADFNNNGVTDTASVKVDTNSDSSYTILKGGPNEYNMLVFNGGGAIGSASYKRSEHASSEPLWDEPEIKDIPTNPVVDRTDFTHLNLKPHHGPQKLQSKDRFPRELFTSEESFLAQGQVQPNSVSPFVRTQDRRDLVNPLPIPFTYNRGRK